MRSDWSSSAPSDWTIEPPGAVHTDHKLVTTQHFIGVQQTEHVPGIWRMSPGVLSYPEIDDIACRIPEGQPLEAWLEIKELIRAKLKVRTSAQKNGYSMNAEGND